jgi:hypothetical protein
MEVASPLSFAPASHGKKRNLTCSPTLMDTLSLTDGGDDDAFRSIKRRRFHGDLSVDSLSENFSSHSPFLSNNMHANKMSSIFTNNGKQ